MNYERNAVLMAYRAEHPSVLEPDDARLASFDRTLHDSYDAEIRRQAGDAGIETTKFNRSMLAFFAARSRAKTKKTQVDHAIRYFRKVKPRAGTVV